MAQLRYMTARGNSQCECVNVVVYDRKGGDVTTCDIGQAMEDNTPTMKNLGGRSNDGVMRKGEERWGSTLGLEERQQHKEMDVR